MNNTIEDIVRDNITVHGTSSHGWNTVYCEVCGDGSRTKGPRGGWLFNGDMAVYHCFNCSVDANFDHTREQPYSKNMWDVLQAFNIPMGDVKKLISEYQLKNNFTTKKTKKVTESVKTLEVPDYFYPLNTAKPKNKIAKEAREFLKNINIDYNDYNFYLSNGKSKMGVRHEAISKSLMNRLIIPFYKNGEMVYYQARGLKGQKKKYINADVKRSGIIYGFDRLYQNINDYLFVTEGFFDAYHLNGVSVQENKLSSAQIDLLKKSPRTKVIVPDFNGDNYTLAEQAIELEWGVAFPNFSDKYKDTTEAIQNIGKLSTLQDIMDNIYFGYDAKTHLMIKSL